MQAKTNMSYTKKQLLALLSKSDQEIYEETVNGGKPSSATMSSDSQSYQKLNNEGENVGNVLEPNAVAASSGFERVCNNLGQSTDKFVALSQNFRDRPHYQVASESSTIQINPRFIPSYSCN